MKAIPIKINVHFRINFIPSYLLV